MMLSAGYEPTRSTRRSDESLAVIHSRRTILSMLRKRVWLWILSGLVGAFAVLFASAAIQIIAASRHSHQGIADAAIVLGAAIIDSRPSPVLQARIDHAIQLLEDGRVRFLVLTGGGNEDPEIPESQAAKSYALARGVSDDAILVDSASDSTFANLVEAKRIAAEENLSSFLIVSDPLHMKRSMLMAGDLGLVARASPTPTSVYRSWHAKASFLLRETTAYLLYLIRRPFILRRALEDTADGHQVASVAGRGIIHGSPAAT